MCGQRLGLYPQKVYDRIGKGADLWIHAVSVGEVMIASVIIRELRGRDPFLKIVISTTTSTGRKVAETLKDERTIVIYNPTDFLWSVRQAFEMIRPKLLILVESEIWPNYIWCAKRRGIPVYLVNARLSSRSEKRYRQFSFFCKPVLEKIDLVFAQDEEDVDRLIGAGFASESVFAMGSLKFDVADLANGGHSIDPWWTKSGWNAGDPVLLGGSTHSGEEEILARIYRQLRQDWPNLKLLLAPRHAERGGQVRQLCRDLGLKTILRTELDQPLHNGSVPEVLVLNTTGELKEVYSKATVVFVGKSLSAKGGQNFIEAAKVGAPILVGPNMQNFQNLTEHFVSEGGVVQVADQFELSQRFRQFLNSPESCRKLGARGRDIFEKNLGAGRRTATAIHQGLEARGCKVRAS